MLVQALQKTRLKHKHGQDVENFGKDMDEMACQIKITASAHIGLSTLVSTAFIDYEVLVFQLKHTGLHDLVKSNTKDLYADEIIWTLKTKLRSLKYQGLWSPSESKKVDMGGEMAGLNLDMNKLVEYQKRYQTSGNGESQDGK